MRMSERQPVEPGCCVHDLPTGSCSEARCRPDGKTLQLEAGPGGLRPEPVPVTVTWAAKWSGECGNCGAAFEADTRIGRAESPDDDRNPYVCGLCCGPVVT